LWTAVGLSRDLPPGATAGLIVEGREWALWRGVSGRAHLWEDRCPHRGMRLSFGFVRGDRLGCLYHGWQYDEGGQCKHIPAHPDLDPPDTIRAGALPLAESGGVIWGCFEGEAPAEPSFPDATPVRTLYLDAPLTAAMAALGPARAAPGARDAYLVEADGLSLLVAGQIVEGDRSALHVSVLAPAGEAARAAKWAARLRYAVERAAREAA
jgi:nitrite reductase/ring-hydroxylating ferredoxin subunit